jgi:hypothetical protein
MADEVPPPLEVPWRLASTTQPLVAGEPDQTSLSLFYHEVSDDLLTSVAPDEKLVYLKFTASISPVSFPGDSRLVAMFLGEGIPCLHLRLDLRVRNQNGDSGSIRPYFHAAEPLHRRMIQTGVVGAELFEGESDGQFMGKSGSQMFETQTTHSKTKSAGGGASFGIGGFSIGGSARITTTDVTSERAAAQTVDTMTREASEERRELVSHMTRVENVLTLLSAKSLGTPHLSFSLSPQPLQLLSIDPSDPNLWFNQLLARRSTGIEGIQEFTTVLVVPRDEDFCIDARLRRVCLLDSPPGPFTVEEQLKVEPNFDLLQLSRMIEYLYRVYPRGTPLDEFDVDLISGLTPASEFRRPVLENWAIRLGPLVVEAIVASPHSTPGIDKRGSVNYKHFLEVWLEVLRDEYEREALRSPLERGVLLGENRHLETCFMSSDGGTVVSSFESSVSPLVRVPIDLGQIDVGGIRDALDPTRATTRTRAFETVTRWNALESQVAGLLERPGELPDDAVGLQDPAVTRVLLDRLAKLRPGDSRNLAFDDAADLLRLSRDQRERLRKAGASDLRSIARALKAAPTLSRHDEDARRLREIPVRRRGGVEPPKPFEFPLSPEEGAEIEAAIAAGLGRDKA